MCGSGYHRQCFLLPLKFFVEWAKQRWLSGDLAECRHHPNSRLLETSAMPDNGITLNYLVVKLGKTVR